MQKKINSFIRKYWLFGMAWCLVFFVSFINTFPRGYTFSGGDAEQFFNLSRISRDFFYTWSSLVGEGFFLQYFSYNIYYVPFYFVNYIFHTSPSSQSFFYYFIFLTLSFCSFYYALGFFAKNEREKVDSKYKTIFSLFYTFNAYTFYNFHYTWGYSPFLFLYVLIPVIFGATYRFFEKSNKKIDYKILSVLGIFFFLSNIANGNMPFFISLNILLALFIASLFVINRRDGNTRVYFKKILAYYLVYFLAVFWSIIPQIPEMFRQLNVFNENGAIFDLKKWLLWQSVKFGNIFFISSGVKEFVKSIGFFGYFSGGAFLLLVISIFLNKRKERKSHFFLVLLIFCIFLMNKGRGIFDDNFIWMIFDNPILSSIRSFDKTFIFLPFFVSIIIFLNLKSSFAKYRRILLVFLTLNCLSVYPFFVGGIQTKYSVSFVSDKNYLNAKYSYLHKIPTEYFSAANLLNGKMADRKILRVPYNVLNSVGWVNYPKWKVIGVDPTNQLFDSPSVNVNAVGSFGAWNYGEYWNRQENEESKWMLLFSGFLNTKYLIYHKDIDDRFICQTKDKIIYYENNNYIEKLVDNDYFNLYKISDKFYLPHFYVSKNSIISQRTVEDLPKILSSPDWQIRSAVFFRGQNDGKEEALAKIQNPNLQISNQSQSSNDQNVNNAALDNGKQILRQAQDDSTLPTLEYKKINPTKYRVRVHRASGVFPVVFSESFHEGWKAYINQNVNLTLPTGRQENQNDPIETLGVNGAGNSKLKIDSYKILDGNSEDQATGEELQDYIDNGYVTTLGDGKEKTIEHKKWVDGEEKLAYIEKHNIDFVSKNFQGTIQNDNLPNGNIFETWLKKPIENNTNHLMANGYANSWVIDANLICQSNSKFKNQISNIKMGDQGLSGNCIQNPDGSYDFEIIVEFWPQRLFYIGLAVSGLTLLGCVVYLGYDWRKRKKLDQKIV